MSPLRPVLSLFVLGTACATGCATGGSTGGTETTVAPSTASMVVGSSAITTMNVGVVNSYAAIATAVPVSPDSAYRLLVRVWTQLAIPISQQAPLGRTVGNDGLDIRRHIAGMNMQDVLDCGDKMGLPNAETWDIHMNIMSYVTDDGKGGAVVSTKIQALGHDDSVSNRDWVACETKSDLEPKIGNMVKALAVAK
jgi:hypothetical protein